MDSPTQTPYEHFLTVYKHFYQTPLQYHFLEYSLFQLLGDYTGKLVLDLGCELGYYSRLIGSSGAARVLAVDNSAEMTDVGKRLEKATPLGIDYFTCEIENFRCQVKFDVVFMMQSLNYATSLRHLQDMLRVAYKHTAPGGRLVAILSHRQRFPGNLEFPNLGLSISCTNVDSNAAKARMKLSLPAATNKTPLIDVFSLFSKSMIDQCLGSAGYRQIEWRPCSVSPHSKLEDSYWEGLVESQFFMGLICVR